MRVYLCKGIQECTRVQVPTEPEKDVRIPRAGVVGNCEPSWRGCWEPDFGPLEEHQVLLTMRSPSSSLMNQGSGKIFEQEN